MIDLQITVRFVLLAQMTWLGIHGAPDAQATVTFRTVATSGEAAPGTGPDLTYRAFLTPQINNAGQVLFGASLAGTGINLSNDIGSWFDDAGTIDLLGREGDPAPGLGAGVTVEFLLGPILSDNGTVGLRGNVLGAGINGTNNTVVWVGSPGSLNLIARENSQAPGAPTGAVFTSLDFVSMQFNNAGQVMFDGRMTGSGIVIGSNDRGIWSQSSGALSLEARTGSPAADLGAGVFYNQFLFASTFNGNGQIGFSGGLSGAGVNASNDSAIWTGTPGALNLVVREGETAPGVGPGLTFSSMNAPLMNDDGDSTFRARLAGAGLNSNNDDGLWADISGGLTLVAREGSPAAGTDPGVVYGNILGSPFINGLGEIGFSGSLSGTGVTGSNDFAIWLGQPGSLELKVREGDAAPGMDPGVVFNRFFNLEFNNAGQMVFHGAMSGPGVSVSDDEGIWLVEPDGSIEMIVREGDLFDVDDDPVATDLRTILDFELDLLSGGQDGRSSSFNDNGQLALDLAFTDTSHGIFVATVSDSLPGDLDMDGFVGINDLNIVLGAWNQNVPPADVRADPSGDGFVGIDDLNVVLGNWNAGTPPRDGAAIPEPVSGMILGGGLLVVLKRPR